MQPYLQGTPLSRNATVFNLRCEATHLQHADDLHFIEEDEGGQRGQEVVLEDGLCGQDDVLDVLHAVRLVDLLPQLRVRDGDHLFEPGRLGEELAVLLGLQQRRLVLQAAHHVHDAVVGEHQLEQRGLVEEEQAVHDLVEVLQALAVVRLLARPEELQQLPDVP